MQGKSKEDDVLVVGGGVIGLACAHYLIRAGRGVRVIDRGRVGEGASHGNCGLVFTSDLVPLCVPGAVRKEIAGMLRGTSPLVVKPGLDFGLITWLVHFAAACRAGRLQASMRVRESILGSSARLFDELFAGCGLQADFERRGVLLVYRSEAAFDSYVSTNRLLEPFGLAATPLVGKSLVEAEPALRPDLFGAWHHRSDAHLRPDALVRSWRQRLVRDGVVFTEGCELTGFRTQGGRIEAVETRIGPIGAREVVLAAGAWSSRMAGRLGVKLPIQPGKGYSITMGRPAVCPRIPCYLHERRVVATPWESGYRLGGTMEFSGFNTDLNCRRLDGLKAAAGDYLRQPLGQPILEEWAGLRPMTYDDLPVIGRAPGFSNLLLATGHGMLGVTTAPATGKLVAELVCGEPPHIDPAPFSVERFR
ncbi:MAG: FAD-dependent oxidoreductase [Desulfobacterales bacterium]